MTSRECFENKWFYMKYIRKYLSGEILLARECRSLFVFCCPFYFRHRIICSSPIYCFWLHLWYLQTCLYIWLQLLTNTVKLVCKGHLGEPEIKVITKLPNSEQSYNGKVQTHNYINRQNQSTTGKLWKP
jgi:hypothetical protein